VRTSPRLALSISAAAALLAGCGGSQRPIGAPGVIPQSRAIARTRTVADHVFPASSYRVLHRFKNYINGASPVAGLLEVTGLLYGTTNSGGRKCSCGTVYSISTTGKLKVLYRFAGGADGAYPQAGLIDVNGTLYGTTFEGGGTFCYAGGGCGTIYSVTTAGVETVLYRFAGGSDGANPFAGLINVNGTMYGTTVYGGSKDKGTVYSVTTAGVKTVLHSFRGFHGGGAHPYGGLIDVNGTLYGTTGAGGAYSKGTVFSMTTAGVETVLHSFGARRSDGAHPQAGLIEVNGTLYGTTEEGGRSQCDDGRGCGAIYSVTTAGVENVLYHFAGGSDGERPLAVLLNVDGTLYGTTYYGGAKDMGTIFSVNPKGREHVVYSFLGCSDGSNPQAPLINVSGTVYGATLWGGGNCYGYGRGAIFALSP
jgi:uncharacterized repeat protein (TIGR03803 family)